MEVKIRIIDVDEISLVCDVLNHLPEFDSIFYKKQLINRVVKSQHIILIAEFAGKPIACKIGYNRYYDGSIYSWLGGVLVPYRNQGIAFKLLNAFEAEARKKLFFSIKMKTQNRHANMLQFSIKNGFNIYNFTKHERILNSRIELIKQL